MQHKGLRYNSDKLRHDLLHPVSVKGLTEVLTMGAKKYPERNWELGMSWSNVIASLKRHLIAIESGEDFDKESGLLHADHLQCNAHFLSAYYSIYPQGDDRPHKYLNIPKIGLDIDDVICDFVPAFMERFNLPQPKNWCWSYESEKHFKFLTDNPDDLKAFYSTLKPKINPDEIPFEPHCYITSRSVPKDITEKWIEDNGFSCKPVYCVDFNHSKIEVAKQSEIEVFVDDRFENFVELNNNGICCFLFDTTWNRRYDVGYKRIKSLSELLTKL